MSVNSETRQRLLELVYGLLTEQEAAALRLRIENEPEIGHAYSQVEKIAARIAEAGRLKTSSIVLERPSSRHGSKRTEESRHRSRSPQVSPRTRIAHWIVGVGSVLLLLVSVWGYVYHHGQLSEIAAGQLRLVVTGPSRLQTGAANTYSVVTMDVKGVPVQSHVEIALYSGNDRQLFRQKEETDPQGRVLLTIPSDISLPTGVRLEIGATHEHKEERIAATMSVEPVRYQTRLSSDRPTYRTGETVYYRSLTLSQFGLLGDRDLSVQFEILDPAGAVVRESSVIGQTKRGVGNGAFRIPEGLPAGRYTLVVRSLDKSFAQERLGFCVMPSKAAPTAAPSAASASAVATDRAASKVKVEFYPEGGELVAGLENRVYFAAWDENGRPADIRGTVVTHEGKSVVDVESTHQGMGTFTFFAAPDELYRLQLTSPVTVAEGVLLPRVSVEQKVGLRTGRGVYDSRSPLEFNIRSTEDRLPLVAAAVCRGVLVAQTAVFAHKGDNPVTLPLAPEVAGVVRLTVYRYASAPARAAGRATGLPSAFSPDADSRGRASPAVQSGGKGEYVADRYQRDRRAGGSDVWGLSGGRNRVGVGRSPFVAGVLLAGRRWNGRKTWRRPISTSPTSLKPPGRWTCCWGRKGGGDSGSRLTIHARPRCRRAG